VVIVVIVVIEKLVNTWKYSVSGNNVSIISILYMPFSSSFSPTARLVAFDGFHQTCWLENLTLTQSADLVQDNIFMFGASSRG